MSVHLSPQQENVPKPDYVLPSTQQIRVTPCKRGREDENNRASVVESAKRVKPLDAVGGRKSTPRAMTNARKSSLLEAKGPPSIHNASEYLDAMFGYDTQIEKHYEYGSDTDEEDPPSDTDEPMESAAADTPSPAEDEDEAMTDISEEAFSAEMDELLEGSDPGMKNLFLIDSDSDSDDEESEFGAADANEEKIVEWAKPGPSPLRHEMDLSPDRPKKLTLVPRKEKPRSVIPIVRSSRRTQGVYCEKVHKKAVNRCHYRSLPLPSVEFGSGVMKFEWFAGKQKPKPPVDGEIPADFFPSAFPSTIPETAPTKKVGMGCGTPPRSMRWTPLTPPPSRYSYSTPDDTVPFARFGQAAFHGGPDAWGTLYRTMRGSTQAADSQTWAGYAGPVRHLLGVGVGPMRRGVEMHTDVRAMQHWRAHGIELGSMPGRVARDELRGVTTGMILEEAARMREFLTGHAAAPSPERAMVGWDAQMGVMTVEGEEVEELGPWQSWTPRPEFELGSSKTGSQ